MRIRIPVFCALLAMTAALAPSSFADRVVMKDGRVLEGSIEKEEADTMKTVRDLLKEKTKEVCSISPKATVFEALKIMGEREIGSLMVMDEANNVQGIVSERDYARKVILQGKTSRETRVEEIMTPLEKMHTVNSNTTVEDCMVLITGKRVRHLPVFDDDKFVGLISIGDVVKAMLLERDTVIEQLSNYIDHYISAKK